jgi:cell wall-associated NlpC family hydrolase
LISTSLFPRLLVIGFAFSFTAAIAAQTIDPDGRPRLAVPASSTPKAKAENPAVPGKEAEETSPAANPDSSQVEFKGLLLASIESHLGASYRYNTTGPNTFDCSGLVWRAFNDVGVTFQRGPARSYWATMTAPAKEEQFRFGNLVFFSGLTHVGIVADEKGFYHSSRHHGVVYSPFNDYWLSRIDGFRQAPPGRMTTTIARDKNRQPKSTPTITITDEGAPR